MKQKLYSEFVETVTSTRLCAGDSCLKATWNKFHWVDLLFKGNSPLPYAVNLLRSSIFNIKSILKDLPETECWATLRSFCLRFRAIVPSTKRRITQILRAENSRESVFSEQRAFRAAGFCFQDNRLLDKWAFRPVG